MKSSRRAAAGLSIPFSPPPSEVIFLRRYKRFFADVLVPESGKTLTVHCPNTGSMKGLLNPGAKALISTSPNPKRKFKHTLECLKAGRSWVCVNTQQANRVVKRLLECKALESLKNWTLTRSEPSFGDNTRFDFQLGSSHNPHPHFVEVKSVTLSETAGLASFPDAVTGRGLKHLTEMDRARKLGYATTLIFLLMRNDCFHFGPAYRLDPAYSQALKISHQNGLQILTPIIRPAKSGFHFEGRSAQLLWLP